MARAGCDDVVVLFGDTPLMRPQTIARLRAPLAAGAAVAVLGFIPPENTGYGRLIEENGRLLAIREEKEATAEQRAIRLCNGGLMALRGDVALDILDRIGPSRVAGEYYLTDAVEIANAAGLACIAVRGDSDDDVLGINTRGELAVAENLLQRRLRSAALAAGVTMIAPDTVFLSADTSFAADVTIEPHVVLGPGVRVGEGASIHAFSHLEGVVVGPGASVGPFARLRPGTELGAGARIGNFVEVKASTLGAGAKANHLAYIGDASVGAGANIGAGTITCNYDGQAKHRTDIGEGAFIGSNSSLVAPVAIGAEAYIGSGSVITRDVPAGALAIARGQQVVKEGWVARLRRLRGGRKTHSPA
jgi:bifunctional UDP-N-acetylglucosamine pyrophosphorylase/glucosamine-1-phosphate N-acetyltransferase